jgi:hypothetical protein
VRARKEIRTVVIGEHVRPGAGPKTKTPPRTASVKNRRARDSRLPESQLVAEESWHAKGENSARIPPASRKAPESVLRLNCGAKNTNRCDTKLRTDEISTCSPACAFSLKSQGFI